MEDATEPGTPEIRTPTMSRVNSGLGVTFGEVREATPKLPKGVCEYCNKPVFSTQPRVRTTTGYLHQACSKLVDLPASKGLNNHCKVVSELTSRIEELQATIDQERGIATALPSPAIASPAAPSLTKTDAAAPAPLVAAATLAAFPTTPSTGRQSSSQVPKSDQPATSPLSPHSAFKIAAQKGQSLLDQHQPQSELAANTPHRTSEAAKRQPGTAEATSKRQPVHGIFSIAGDCVL